MCYNHRSRRRLMLTFFFASAIFTQAAAQFPNRLKEGLKTYLNDDSTAYLKLSFVSQVWVRFNQSNPGTTVNNEPESNTFDVGLRRIRFVLSGQLSDRVFIFVQFGQDNFNYLSTRKTGAFFHDVTGEYAIVKKHLNLGFGLHGWNGPGRFSNSAVSNIMGLDPPIFEETTNDVNDQFVRKLGTYAKGKLGKLDYRVSVSTPFVAQTNVNVDPLTQENYTYATQVPKAAYQGYFMYQFLDQESNLNPGTVGSYLGTKRVFNIGGGFVYQNRAMWAKPTDSNDTLYHAMRLMGLDFFYDTPLDARGRAITVYGGYFNFDFGKGYLRNVGAMNPANGTRNGSFNGPGNAFPMIGTGDTFYLQSAYKLRNNLLGEELGTLQFYAAVQYSNYTRLRGPMSTVDAGINWLLRGHGNKFIFGYQNRPIFAIATDNALVLDSRRSQWVLKYQVAF